mmetsp:Transcript_11506/g.34112  ORF Transcript_11506/g.34112 Transcript_11506/m.34112 type:complete len:306 (-) Transcript_11506:368-1285(-)
MVWAAHPSHSRVRALHAVRTPFWSALSLPIPAECYLQLAPEHTITHAGCPYCKDPRLHVSFSGPRSEKEVREEALQRQQLIAAQVRMLRDFVRLRRSERGDGKDPATSSPEAPTRTTSRSSTASSSSVSVAFSPLPSPELLATSPEGAALLASPELSGLLPRAIDMSAARAPPLVLEVASDPSYAQRWERAQQDQLSAAKDSLRANQDLPPPPEYVAPPRTLEGVVGSSALAGSMAGWSHSEAQDVEELMLLEAIRLSLEEHGQGGQEGGGAHAEDAGDCHAGSSATRRNGTHAGRLRTVAVSSS